MVPSSGGRTVSADIFCAEITAEKSQRLWGSLNTNFDARDCLLSEPLINDRTAHIKRTVPAELFGSSSEGKNARSIPVQNAGREQTKANWKLFQGFWS
jgi:hypothetical protein